MTVPLPPDEQRTVHAEGEDHMFERAGVTVFDQVVQKPDVALVHRLLELAEGDPGGVDDRRLRAEVIDQADPSLAVEDFHMIGWRYVEMFHSLALPLAARAAALCVDCYFVFVSFVPGAGAFSPASFSSSCTSILAAAADFSTAADMA